MNLYRLYFTLTLIGIILPIVAIVHGMQLIDWNISMALKDLFTFVSSTFGQMVIAWLFTSGISLSIFAIHESMVRRDYYLLWTIPMIILFSVGAALPFYLYLRSPKRDQ